MAGGTWQGAALLKNRQNTHTKFHALYQLTTLLITFNNNDEDDDDDDDDDDNGNDYDYDNFMLFNL